MGLHPRIAAHREAWLHKPALREIYADIARRILEASTAGPTIEVGAGSGWLSQFIPGVIRTDLLRTPWVDMQASALDLPFRDGSVGNVVGVDVVHHLARPAAFFDEVERVLRPGGRCVLVEPAITPLSWPFFKMYHDEVVDLGADPLGDISPSNKDPFEANQAVPTLLFRGDAQPFRRRFPDLRVLDVQRFSFFAYPLSGGFRKWSAIPRRWVRPLLKLERRLEPYAGRVAAFRMMVELEKSVVPRGCRHRTSAR